MEVALKALATFFALTLIVTWPIRGGSFPLWKPRRWLALLVTPIMLSVIFSLHHIATFEWREGEEQWSIFLMGLLYINIGSALFLAAQVMGWGRQMDLGRNDRPDDELFYQVRDLFFKEKSSFWRDLTGLYMRFFQFTLASLIWLMVEGYYVILGIAMSLFTPLLWVLEHKLWWSRGVQPGFAFVEYAVGLMMAIVTICIIWVA